MLYYTDINYTEQDMKRWWNEKDLLQFDNEKIISKDITVNDVVEMILNEFTSCMYENIFFIFIYIFNWHFEKGVIL